MQCDTLVRARLARLVGRAMASREHLAAWQLRRLWRLAKMLDQQGLRRVVRK